jgi:Spy/CpxP family protein refolding chaperone
MKKALAIAVMTMFMLGTVAFAEEAAKPAAAPAAKAASGEKSVPKTFFGDAQDLVTKKIPETPNQKSKTHRIWNQTGKKAAATK